MVLRRAGAAFLAVVLRRAGAALLAVVLRRTAVFLAAALGRAAGLALATTTGLPAMRTAASSVGHTPRFSLGAVDGFITASLKALTGVILAFLEALILIASPVAGLRPMRAARLTLTYFAKPETTTGSPCDTTAVTTSVKPSRTATTVLRSTSEWTATALASSRLFIAAYCAEKHSVVQFLSLKVRVHGSEWAYEALKKGPFGRGHARFGSRICPNATSKCRGGVLVRSDAKRGLLAAMLGHFDAVITDFNMPGIDGLEMVRRLRGVLHQRIPVALCTQKKDDDLIGLKRLNVDYINKSDLAGVVAWVSTNVSGAVSPALK